MLLINFKLEGGSSEDKPGHMFGELLVNCVVSVIGIVGFVLCLSGLFFLGVFFLSIFFGGGLGSSGSGS